MGIGNAKVSKAPSRSDQAVSSVEAGGNDHLLALAPPSLLDGMAAVLPDPATIPSAPEDFKPIEDQRVLRSMPETQRSEFERALQFLVGAERDGSLASELGPLMPTPGKAAVLLKRLTSAHQGSARARRLASWLDEQSSLADHQVIEFIDDIAPDAASIVRKRPGLRDRYDAILKIGEQRADAISMGLARRRATDKEIAAAKTAPEPTTPEPDPTNHANGNG